jgi:uncharacterized protein YcbX
MAHVARLRIYPVKALDGVDVETAGLTPGGGLAGDREFALFDGDGEVINGKRTDRVHRLRTDYDPSNDTLTVGTGGASAPDSFDLGSETGRAEDWFSDYFEQSVRLRRDGDRGFPDRPEAGPSVVSTATVETVASWFDELTVDGVRRRLRCNVEVGGVPAFWEDRFVGDGAPVFVIRTTDGPDVRFEGVEPCGRCVVPTRDPDTGAPTPGFRERFIERRAATFPDWAHRDAFPHDYTLMLIARVPEAGRNGTLRVGDEVTVPGDGG